MASWPLSYLVMKKKSITPSSRSLCAPKGRSANVPSTMSQRALTPLLIFSSGHEQRHLKPQAPSISELFFFFTFPNMWKVQQSVQ